WTRRRVQTVTTWVVVVAWVVFYAVALATADPLPPLEAAVVQLVVPALLWVVAARLVVRHWWSGPGSRMSGMDLPGRLLAVAVAALPERRREWGRAMLAELAEVQGRSARWRFAAWFWLANRTDGIEPPLPLVLLLALVLVSAPVAVFFVPAFAAGRAGRSFRSGLQAAVWTVTAMIPLTYAVWLPEGLRRHAIDGRLLVDGEVVAPVGVNLADALVFCLGIFPVLGLTLAVVGAGLGARTTHRAVPNDPS
ncbi:MAG TPA: hypothetical protein VK942_17290, partial [Actinomycetes bacterium]|nr:hypothetical protein [Actinomycetes bacterium]